MTKVQGRIFAVLHTIGSLALIVLLSLLVGCLRDEPLETDSKNQVSPEKIVEEILNNASAPDALNAGDSVWTGHYARTFTNPFLIIETDTHEITKKEYFEENTDDGVIKYNLYGIKHINADEDGTIIQIREDKCRLILNPVIGWYPECKIPLPPFQDQFYNLSVETSANAFNAFASSVVPFSLRPAARAMKFYNLTVRPVLAPLPAKMVTAGKCFGHADCKVPATVIEFDMESDEETDVSSRQHYTLTVTKQLPYLGSNLETCVGYQTFVDGSTALIDECFRTLDITVAPQ